MGEVLAFHGASERSSVDALSVAVSAVLWRLGGRGSLRQVAPLVALADERLRTGRCDAVLRLLIEEHLLQRKRDGFAPLLYVGPEPDDIGLTDLTLGILGPCPGGSDVQIDHPSTTRKKHVAGPPSRDFFDADPN